MKVFALRFFLTMVSVLLLGCATKNPETIAPEIQVAFPVSQEISKTSGTGWDLELTNESNYCVIFPLVSGLKIYTEKGGSRIEVENLLNIIGDENLIVNPKGQIFSSRFVGILPDLSSITVTEPMQFFVSLSGYLCDDEYIKITKVIPFTVVP